MDIKAALNKFIPPSLLVLGLIGNFGFMLVYSQKRFRNFSFRFIFIILSIFDSIYLIFNMGIDCLNYLLNWDIKNKSAVSCVLIDYFGYFLGPISPWIIVYVSFERLVSISPMLHRFNKMKKKQCQIAYIVLVAMFNVVYYLPVLLVLNKDDQSLNITIFDCEELNINIVYMDLFLSTVIPAFLMLFSTAMIIFSIFNSTNRMAKHGVAKIKRRIRKDIKFSITSIFLNVVFIILNLPLCVIYLDADNFDKNNLNYIVSLYLFYCTYAINFYLFLVVNSSFRNEFLKLIHLKHSNLVSELSNDFNRKETFRQTIKN
jgi:hypothetical protein